MAKLLCCRSTSIDLPLRNLANGEAHRFSRVSDLGRCGGVDDRVLGVVERFDFSRLWTFANYSGEAGGSVWPAVSGNWVFLLGETLANVERGEESEMKPKRTAALDHGAW